MLKKTISSYSLLIGLILIAYNTALLITELTLCVGILAFTLLWELCKIALSSLRDYPLTILIIVIIMINLK